MNKISVFLADDHTMLRDGLKSILHKNDGIEVIGEAGDGLEAVKKIKAIRPDVCIIDISMPRIKGIDVIRMAKEAAPNMKIVVLTMHDKEEYIYQALKNGASGYVLKSSSSE
ncbi:MAG: response regulator transcription factor, partial [Thermodesulfobacteriota bacterium]|nr:response regulator transcription factor [Thermodesulfobacteriota bacterium]